MAPKRPHEYTSNSNDKVINNTTQINSEFDVRVKKHNLNTIDTIDLDQPRVSGPKRQAIASDYEFSTEAPSLLSRVWSWLSDYKGPPSLRMFKPPTQGFLNLINCADSDLNSNVLFTTDQYFGPTYNMLKPSEPTPVTLDKTHTKMDAWLTKRRREIGHDWCVIRLCQPAAIYGFEIDLRYLGMEKVPRLSVEGVYCHELDNASLPNEQDMSFELLRDADKKIDHIIKSSGTEWVDLLDADQAFFEGQKDEDQTHFFSIEDPNLIVPFTHLRINLFPDGGISRFRAYGITTSIPSYIRPSDQPINVLSAQNGAYLIAFKDTTLSSGHPKNIISKNDQIYRWETVRNFRRDPIVSHTSNSVDFEGDWAVFRLSKRAIMEEIILGFTGSEGRIPQKIVIQHLDYIGKPISNYLEEQKRFIIGNSKGISTGWKLLSEITIKDTDPIKIDLIKRYPDRSKRIATHIRLIMIPEGAISTFQIMGSSIVYEPEKKIK